MAQERALAITPKCMSALSIPCSMFLIYEIYCDHKRIGTNSIQRVLVGMSIVDILASSAWFLSTWAVPAGSFAYSAGNQASCNFQGFLLQLAIGAPLYNSSLALFYILMIKQRWPDAQLVAIEKWVHGFIISFTLGTSILLLFLDQYNHIAAVCWIIGSPPDCGNSSFQGSDVPCERGDHAWAWGLALFYCPLWICVIACCTSMVLLYLEVRKTLRRSRRYSTRLGAQDSLGRSGRDSSKVAKQAILYSLTFLITWMPSTLWSVAHWFQWSHYALDIAAATAEPLQGFWNLLIFLRTRPKTVQKLQRWLAFLLPCCCIAPDEEPEISSYSRASVTRSIKSVMRVFGPLSDWSDIPANSARKDERATPIRGFGNTSAYSFALSEDAKSCEVDNASDKFRQQLEAPEESPNHSTVSAEAEATTLPGVEESHDTTTSQTIDKHETKVAPLDDCDQSESGCVKETKGADTAGSESPDIGKASEPSNKRSTSDPELTPYLKTSRVDDSQVQPTKLIRHASF